MKGLDSTSGNFKLGARVHEANRSKRALKAEIISLQLRNLWISQCVKSVEQSIKRQRAHFPNIVMIPSYPTPLYKLHTSPPTVVQIATPSSRKSHLLFAQSSFAAQVQVILLHKTDPLLHGNSWPAGLRHSTPLCRFVQSANCPKSCADQQSV